jgi:cysteine-rich repeat protein
MSFHTTVAALSMAATIGTGCGSRSLDPNQTGTGGGAIMTGTGGATGDGGLGADALLDLRSPFDSFPGVEPQGGPICGNGGLDPGEECDDGNVVSGDGCSRGCQIEACWACGTCGTNVPCVPTPICGDGVLTYPERCDDGNNQGGDGCSADCTTIETGWQCTRTGYRCFPICGDRMIVGAEQCDDGNATGGDGCSDICVSEPTTARCGDAMIEGAEQCDNGADNSDTLYAACTTHCRFAVCGDGVVNGLEQCDDGFEQNVTTYGNMSGCAPSCTFPHFCGDGILDDAEGEQCDLGADNGSGSYCTRNCKVLI